MKYFIVGRVQPERASVSFSTVNTILDTGEAITASCDASQLAIVMETQIDDLVTAKIMAEQFASIIVGSLGFSKNFGYSVEIIHVIGDSESSVVFGVGFNSENSDVSPNSELEGVIFNRAIILSGRDVFFRLAIRDYLRAITDSIDCAFYCYRAIEGIKSAFISPICLDGWSKMHEALSTNRNSITGTVKDFADAIRHGNWVQAKTTNNQQRWDMLILTKQILIKYLDYALSIQT